ncbi:MAG TPA: ubiquinol-cytochrome c reductase cytochrome b subunit [Acidimicrobiales bacterium]|nr:ubiquinol-cytochrome c reductase cytochrome b subunit [Acidimicrobiales bacterium]
MTTSPPTTSRNGKRGAKAGPVDGTIRWLDDRLGVAKGGRVLLDKIFPDHWSFLLGEIALYSFVVLLATGVFLSLYFVPSASEVVYHGVYAPLRGVRMSAAYASTVDLSFAVRSGLVIRQMHHWAADVFVGAIAVHMARIFFTGAYRKPRELNWIIGITLLMLAIVNGFLGYSLPDDLVSGTGIRIAYSIILSIPVVGSYLATFVFGGNFPGNGVIIPRFFILHVLILPVVIGALIAAHLGLLVRQKHTQFPGHGRTETNVVGTPMYPTFILKTTGFLFMITGVLWALGGLVQINPIWQFGPYEPTRISYAVQPDWYMGWLDGALRIMPSWEFTGFGHTIPFEVFLPAVLFPGLTFTLFYLWPFVEAKITGGNTSHHLLTRPRERPLHTAVGAAGVAFYFMLFGASSTDVLANFLQVSLNTVLWSFRILVFVVPVIVGFVTWSLCRQMIGVAGIGKRKRAVVVTRSEMGEYATTPTPPRPGDGHVELHPEPVPAFMEPGAEAVGAPGEGLGVRRIPRP